MSASVILNGSYAKFATILPYYDEENGLVFRIRKHQGDPIFLGYTTINIFPYMSFEVWVSEDLINWAVSEGYLPSSTEGVFIDSSNTSSLPAEELSSSTNALDSGYKCFRKLFMTTNSTNNAYYQNSLFQKWADYGSLVFKNPSTGKSLTLATFEITTLDNL